MDVEGTELIKSLDDTQNINSLKKDTECTVINNKECTDNPSVSIVMSYYNRREQLEITLNTISNSLCKNIEVIIIDDASDIYHDIKSMIYKYKFYIQLVIINKEQKKWINPCVPYNIGLSLARAEKIIIQNPEICHIGDVIDYVNKNLNDGTYMAFSVFALPSFTHNNEIKCMVNDKKVVCNFINNINYNVYGYDDEYYKNAYDDVKQISSDERINHFKKIGLSQGRKCNNAGIYHQKEYINWKGWYNHPIYKNRPFHFLSAITRNDLNKIGGFDNKFKDGFWYDDDDFLNRIKKICTVNNNNPDGCFGVHLYHHNGSSDMIQNNSFSKLSKINKNIYDNNIKNNVIRVENKQYLDVPENKYLCLNNKKIIIENFKIAICVKTFFSSSTKEERLNIMDTCFKNILVNKSSADVFIFVDGDTMKKHIDILNKYTSFNIIYCKKNRGIAGITNYTLRYIFNRGYDIIYMCDDDICIKNNFVYEYTKSILNSGIEHISYYPFNELLRAHIIKKSIPKIYKEINGVYFVNYLIGFSGCMFSVTKNLINKIGYFPLLKYKYGYEHEIFTKNYNNYLGNAVGQVDIKNSNDYIELNEKSFLIKSEKFDYSLIKLNEIESKKMIKPKTEYNDNDIIISIIIPYYNKMELLCYTIDSITKSDFYNYEIIIVNDCSNDYYKLHELETQYDFIKIIDISPNDKKNRSNPCIPFNMGIAKSKGDIIILQSPESYHINILQYVYNNLQIGQYMIFSSYNIPSEETNKIFINCDDKSIINLDKITENDRNKTRYIKWCQHPIYRNIQYHFCSAIHKKHLEIIGNFDEENANGYDELVFKIEKNGELKIIPVLPDEAYIVNLYHSTSISANIDQVLDDNSIKKKLLTDQKNYLNETKKMNFSYPRLINLFWYGKLSFLNYITVLSFHKYHPEWIINVFNTNFSNKNYEWTTGEQSNIDNYFIDYFDKLKSLKYVNIINLDDVIMNELKISNLNCVHQSNILRVYLINKYGGLWSDFDIIYIKNIENCKLLCDENRSIIFKCRDINGYVYYPVGLFLTNKNSEFFSEILRVQLDIKNNKNKSYQVYGVNTITKVIESFSNAKKLDNNVKILDNKFYLLYQWNELGKLFDEKITSFNEQTYGIHWFNGSKIARTYISKFNKKEFIVKSTIDYLINEYINEI